MAYLIHFNQNHNPRNGRFDFGDGDGDGQLNERQIRKLEEKDNKWAKKNYSKLMNKAYKPVSKKMKKYVNKNLNVKYRQQLRRGQISRSYVNDYNQKLTELMNEQINSLPTAPSGRIVKFIAKRGDFGVHMALADPEFDISQFRRGIYGSGRVAYRQQHVNMA